MLASCILLAMCDTVLNQLLTLLVFVKVLVFFFWFIRIPNQCYGSTAITNMFTLTARESNLDVRNFLVVERYEKTTAIISLVLCSAKPKGSVFLQEKQADTAFCFCTAVL